MVFCFLPARFWTEESPITYPEFTTKEKEKLPDIYPNGPVLHSTVTFPESVVATSARRPRLPFGKAEVMKIAAKIAHDKKKEIAAKKQKVSFGPFPSPYTFYQHNIYNGMLFPYRPAYLVEDRATYAVYNKQDESLSRLLVGDVIRYKDEGLVSKQMQIFDFEKDHFIIGPGPQDLLEFSAKSKPHGGITRVRGTNTTDILDPDKLWVKRDPPMTEEMKDNFNKWWASLERGKQQPQVTEPKNPDRQWRRLCEIPILGNREGKIHTKAEAGNSNNAERPCFICGDPVTPYPTQPDWISVPSSFYGHDRQRTLPAMHRLTEHCTTYHPGSMYHFLHKSPLDAMKDEPYTFTLHAQKALRRAIEQNETIVKVDSTLHYDLFLTALKYNDPVPLKLALAYIFGCVANCIGEARDLKKIKKYKEVCLEACNTFHELAKTAISDMHAAFMKFDFRPLLPPGKVWPLGPDKLDRDVAKIWNATHLFFRRGLYNETPFPAIRHVTLPTMTLEETEERAALTDPSPKKINPKKRKAAAPALASLDMGEFSL